MPSIIAPGAFILRSNDPEWAVDVWHQVVQTKNVEYTFKENQFGTEDSIIVPDYVMEQILLYSRSGEYAQMSLREFLDRINSPEPS